MTHEQFVAFWAGMLWNAAKIQYARTRAYLAEQVRRHFDRYFRVGRHRPIVVGLAHIRWSEHIVAELREDRELRHHQLLPV